MASDCSGPTQGGLQWLKRAGFSVPKKEVYNPHMRYWTLEYTVDPAIMAKFVVKDFDKTTGWLLFNFPSIKQEQRISMIEQIENNRRELFCLLFITGSAS